MNAPQHPRNTSSIPVFPTNTQTDLNRHLALYELSLFSGAGGGLLGSKLLGWTTVGYVENNDYCQKVLAQRIEDGILDPAPIFGDINGFIESGAAKKYKGFVDVVTGGFPCQPFSTAGKRKAQDDSRNLWPQTLAVLCDVRPRYALLENVTGLLTVNGGGYFAQILADLAESGFDVRWDCISASAIGAPHRRNRLWILAKSQHSDTDSIGPHRAQKHEHRSSEPNDQQVGEFGSVCEVLADSDTGHDSRAQEEVRARRHASDDGSEDVADSDSQWELQQKGLEQKQRRWISDSSSDVADSDSIDGKNRRGMHPGIHRSKEDSRKERPCRGGRRWSSGYWPTEPDVGRVAHGVASRVDRLKAIGNGQVPLVAATAWEILNDSIDALD